MRSLFAAVLLAGCISQGGKEVPPVKAGDGVSVDAATQTVTVDSTKVPVVPSCGDGLFVRRTAAGWECAQPGWTSISGKPDSFPAAVHSHAAADVTNFSAAAVTAMGTKAAGNPFNHDRYTNPEAVAAMGPLDPTNPHNHTRYTDGEAVGAMGVKSAANPLNHDRYTDLQAMGAMGVKSASNPMNHDRYGDGEAISAMGAKSPANPMNHNRYTDAEALAAVSSASAVGIGTGASIPAAKLEVDGDVRIVDGNQGIGKVLTSDANGSASWQAPVATPSGAVMFFNLNACPTGWTELVAARGRYLVGVPLGGALNTSVGTALTEGENRPAGAHSHPIFTYSGGGDTNFRILWGTSNNASQVPLQPSDVGAPPGAVAGTNAPYLELRVCQKT